VINFSDSKASLELRFGLTLATTSFSCSLFINYFNFIICMLFILWSFR
jgi:hypothetical protein